MFVFCWCLRNACCSKITVAAVGRRFARYSRRLPDENERSFVSKPKKSKGKRSATKKQCKLCEVEFNSSRSFHDHLRGIHGVAKPYVCHVCTKCFPYASSLYNHLKIHSPDRPFICKLCGSTFRWKFLATKLLRMFFNGQNGALSFYVSDEVVFLEAIGMSIPS
ncbi:zf-H2C2 2 domain containing protein [Trichuris trichiura]|uniref:Zf-H2C2 2 domain containing protein n=1 Tax=Trichuris trichiura TaxID=36087 RepID=A0A077ZB39_TRITR|nr:zf-H2C2 2 domain containing protein [Trichuris trichiura]